MYAHAKDIAQQLIELYTKAEVDAVYIAYNEFKSVIQQRIVVEKLLPLGRADLEGRPVAESTTFSNNRRRRFSIACFRAMWKSKSIAHLLESAAAEHGARMAAMDTATRNAGEMIESLTLNMNRVRQAAITREIIEVVSGAGAQ